MTAMNTFLKMRRSGRRRAAATLTAALVFVAGCGSGIKVAAPAVSPAAPASDLRTYFAGVVNTVASGTVPAPANSLATYTFDDLARTFAQSTYAFGVQSSIFGGAQNGPQLNYSGYFAPLARGLLDLGTTYAQTPMGPVDYNPAITGNWAVELPGQAGALVGLSGMAFAPLVPAEDCPAGKTTASFQFITIPSLGTGPVSPYQAGVDTAYGSVDVSADAQGTLFSNIEQFTDEGIQVRNYSTIGVTPAPAAYTSIAGACSQTFYGNTISVPGKLAITSPGVGETIENAATIAIGPSGMLVEANGNGYSGPGNLSSAKVSPIFQPFMGAGTGAMGLPKPSSPLDIGSLTAAQYLGFFYGFDNNENSTVASFGFASGTPANCAEVTASTATLIYGGDFDNNDPGAAPVQANGGFGNCDAAIDLGTQDPKNNGLFPDATVTEGPSFASNATGESEVLPAVAIAGTLGGKFAIFLITSTGQGIYLLQSN